MCCCVQQRFLVLAGFITPDREVMEKAGLTGWAGDAEPVMTEKRHLMGRVGIGRLPGGGYKKQAVTFGVIVREGKKKEVP